MNKEKIYIESQYINDYVGNDFDKLSKKERLKLKQLIEKRKKI